MKKSFVEIAIPLPPAVAERPQPVLLARLLIVTLFAKRLPVALVPEERHVATVRGDVVNDSSLSKLSVSLALFAEWMRVEIGSAGLLPTRRVSSLVRCLIVILFPI